jgi:serine/threonine protein kinase
LKRVFEGSQTLDNKYQIQHVLGKGGMGAVYLATHLALNRTFAVKLIDPQNVSQGDYLQRFELEAKALGRLKHPNIVEVTDYGIDSRGIPYLVMEFMQGISLEQHLRGHGALDPEEALSILTGIATGLDFAHKHGILHRDLKPGNVFLISSGSRFSQVKIVDFGLARFVGSNVSIEQATTKKLVAGAEVSETLSLSDEISDQRLTLPGRIMGTSGYIAPEVWEAGKVSAASDIFSFGVISYQIFSGKLPFTGSPVEQLGKMIQGPFRPSDINPRLPAELDAPLCSCLASDAQQRPSHASLAVEEIRKMLQAARVREWKQTEFPLRAGLALLLAILLTASLPLISGIPPLQSLENSFFDLRTYLLPVHAPDPRIMILSLDESTLAKDSTPLASKADEMGALLRDIREKGAAAIAIDLTLPDYWKDSEVFTQFVMEHQDRLAVAIQADNQKYVGTGFTDGPVLLALGEEKTRNLFGLANIRPESDGVVRRFRTSFRGADGRDLPSFAFRSAELLTGSLLHSSVWIDYSMDLRGLRKISWSNAEEVLLKTPDIFRDKLVLVGAEFAGSGDYFQQ